MSNQDLDTAQKHIAQLDLSYIVDAMCAPEYPLPRWTREDALKCCELYKKFLFLLCKYSTDALVPSRDIDEFWHNHILYTKNYINDCQQIFGYYLHHEPASPKDNPQELIEGYQRTKHYYQLEFNHPLELVK